MPSAPFRASWEAHASQYQNDLLLFGEEQWVVNDTGKLITWADHQRQVLPLMLTRGGITSDSHPDIWSELTPEGREIVATSKPGRFTWPIMVWSEPKKCVAPDSRVLTDDLRWVRADSLSAGDGLVGFDEELVRGPGITKPYRFYRQSYVTDAERAVLPSVLVRLMDGREVVVSEEHRFLCRKNARGNNVSWKLAKNLRPGDLVLDMLPVWDRLEGPEASYLAAALDGEGYVGYRDTKAHRGGYRANFSQLPNAMLQRVIRYLDELGLSPKSASRTRRHDGLVTLDWHGRAEVTRLLGSLRPHRLLDKFQPDKLGRAGAYRDVEVISVSQVGTSEVVALGTTTRTFLSDGLASHNSGKSEIEGIVGEWVVLSEPGVNQAFFIANDQEQSQGRGYQRIVDHLNPGSPSYNPVVASLMRTKIKPITRPPSRLDMIPGDFIRAIPTDYAGEAGANPTISLWDELWAYTLENLHRLWDEFTIPPTRYNGCKFIATYAGFRDESLLLWDLYEKTVRKGIRIHKSLEVYASHEGDVVAFWSNTPRMPWQTDEYYKREKASLRPDAYKRLHENKWTRSQNAFIDPDAWDSLPIVIIKPPESKTFPVYIGGDGSHKRDATAGVALGWHPPADKYPIGYPFLVRHKIWTPSPGKPVIPEDTLGPWLEDMVSRFYVRRIGLDPNHLETLIYRLKRKGLPVEPYEQTVDNLTSAGDALYTAIMSGEFLRYPAPDLERHVLSATAKEGPRGWKLSKELARVHIDGAVALSFAMALAREFGPRDVDKAAIMFFLGDTDEGWVP